MKTTITLLAIILTLILFFSYKPKFNLHKTYASPDNKYLLEIYVEKKKKSILSIQHEFGFRKSYVILKDEKGSLLAKPSIINPCKFIIDDFQINWEKEKVYFTKFNYINLKDYSLDCY